MRYRNKPNIRKEEPHIPEPISVAFGDLDFVVKSLKLAGVDRKFRVSDQAVEAFELLTAELGKGRNPAVNGGVKPFGPLRRR